MEAQLLNSSSTAIATIYETHTLSESAVAAETEISTYIIGARAIRGRKLRVTGNVLNTNNLGSARTYRFYLGSTVIFQFAQVTTQASPTFCFVLSDNDGAQRSAFFMPYGGSGITPAQTIWTASEDTTAELEFSVTVTQAAFAASDKGGITWLSVERI
jgi:hypothetical protein